MGKNGKGNKRTETRNQTKQCAGKPAWEASRSHSEIEDNWCCADARVVEHQHPQPARCHGSLFSLISRAHWTVKLRAPPGSNACSAPLARGGQPNRALINVGACAHISKGARIQHHHPHIALRMATGDWFRSGSVGCGRPRRAIAGVPPAAHAVRLVDPKLARCPMTDASRARSWPIRAAVIVIVCDGFGPLGRTMADGCVGLDFAALFMLFGVHVSPLVVEFFCCND